MSLRNWAFRAATEGRFAHSGWLKPLSFLWGKGALCKNWLYDVGCLPIHELDVPVVSVGNLVAGGVGKTPLVHLLAQSLPGPLALLSRGYRAEKGRLGDEMQMLLRKLPKSVKGYSGKDRVELGQRAVQEGAKLVLLDDGFQHRRLHRDFELLVIDSSNPLGYNDYLPRGLLRDPPERCREADALFVYGDKPLPDSLSNHQNIPTIRVELGVKRVVDYASQTEVPALPSCIGAFCAIGHPDRFFKTLAGRQIVDGWTLADHEPFLPENLQDFALHCQRRSAEALVCTEKDAVKLGECFLPLPVLYLEMELRILTGEENYRGLLHKICKCIST